MIFFLSIIPLSANEYITTQQLESMKHTYGQRAAQRLENWNNVMKNAESKEEQIQVRNINSYFNQYRYKQDKYNWKNVEYWASFSEFIGKGTGDCEDYALAKYYSLRKLGIPSYKLRLISGKFKGKGHLLLAYYKDGDDPYILDNNSRYLGKLSKSYRFKAETYFNEDEHGVINPDVEDKRALFEYEYFYRWISKNAVSLAW